MSWDAYLQTDCDKCGHSETHHEVNYTHNCNAMMATVLEENGHTLEKNWLIGYMGKSWFDALNGLSGEDGAKLLDLIVFGMASQPGRFRAMNPDNGWGSYDGVLVVLRAMLEASRQNPKAKWRVNG